MDTLRYRHTLVRQRGDEISDEDRAWFWAFYQRAVEAVDVLGAHHLRIDTSRASDACARRLDGFDVIVNKVERGREVWWEGEIQHRTRTAMLLFVSVLEPL